MYTSSIITVKKILIENIGPSLWNVIRTSQRIRKYGSFEKSWWLFGTVVQNVMNKHKSICVLEAGKQWILSIIPSIQHHFGCKLENFAGIHRVVDSIGFSLLMVVFCIKVCVSVWRRPSKPHNPLWIEPDYFGVWKIIWMHGFVEYLQEFSFFIFLCLILFYILFYLVYRLSKVTVTEMKPDKEVISSCLSKGFQIIEDHMSVFECTKKKSFYIKFDF
ncbi:MAG: hypothetical protein GY714_14805 [Desulfobacterales bacterium]|nr:hypothetical protein [Desulfobacterales bacterium]